VTISLQNNEITGTIPNELVKFKFLDINLAGNKIEEIPQVLCKISGWMQGVVGEIGNCSAILCPEGTFNQFGHHSPENPCMECSHLVSINTLGNTRCENFTSERDTLLKFYADTGGEFWVNSTLWNSDAPICSWFGVLCGDGDLQDSFGITQIKLDSNGLSGTLPSEIWTLPSLESLRVDQNEGLTVDLRGVVNAANTLDTLSLSHVKMSSLAGISAATNLKKFSIVGNKLTGKRILMLCT
jgi:Leucine-rich repeat (LRR) protein